MGYLLHHHSYQSRRRKDVKNGAMVAADVGVLVPGNGGVGLQLSYDQRLKEFLKIKDTSKILMVQEMWSTE